MRVFRYLGSVIIGLALLVPGFAKDKVVVESKWTAAPIQIDGSQADWAPEDLILNKDYDLGYAIKNDANFVYLLFVFNLKQGAMKRFENKYMSTIDFTGLTLWLNAEGKEKKTYGLRFRPRQVTADQLIQEMEKQGQTLTDEQKQGIKAKPRYSLFACDVINKKGDVVPNPEASKGTFRTSKIQNSIVFEYQIPVALLGDPASATKWDPSLPLKVGFEWGGATPDMLKAQGSQLGQQGTRTGGGETSLESQIRSGYEGGGGGSRDFDAADRRRALPKKYDFWIDLKLATKQ
jgi:hypothetical protein